MYLIDDILYNKILEPQSLHAYQQVIPETHAVYYDTRPTKYYTGHTGYTPPTEFANNKPPPAEPEIDYHSSSTQTAPINRLNMNTQTHTHDDNTTQTDHIPTVNRWTHMQKSLSTPSQTLAPAQTVHIPTANSYVQTNLPISTPSQVWTQTDYIPTANSSVQTNLTKPQVNHVQSQTDIATNSAVQPHLHPVSNTVQDSSVQEQNTSKRVSHTHRRPKTSLIINKYKGRTVTPIKPRIKTIFKKHDKKPSKEIDNPNDSNQTVDTVKHSVRLHPKISSLKRYKGRKMPPLKNIMKRTKVMSLEGTSGMDDKEHDKKPSKEIDNPNDSNQTVDAVKHSVRLHPKISSLNRYKGRKMPPFKNIMKRKKVEPLDPLEGTSGMGDKALINFMNDDEVDNIVDLTTCKICNTTFKNITNLRRHIKNIHTDFQDNHPKGEKRAADTEPEGTFTKSIKTRPKPSINYENYF